MELAKPNKKIISNISEKINDTANLKLGNINELNFTIPHKIDGQYNEHVELVKEKMLIKFTYGTYKEWFIVDNIEEDGDEVDLFNVKAFSLGYELKGKRVPSLVEENINAQELLEKILEPTIWKIGEIDPIFNEMFRAFDAQSTNVLDSIIQSAETYGALIIWDSLTRTVSFKDMEDYGKFKGMTVDYGRFLQNIKRTRTTDEMVTRLHIYGNEDISIHAVNPTGQGYIEDFSFFMYPFERDENRKIIHHSDYMSDELCHAILDHQIIVKENAPKISEFLTEKAELESTAFSLESSISNAQLELENILTLLDVAQASGDSVAIEKRKEERNLKQSEIQAIQLQLGNYLLSLKNVEAKIDHYQDAISLDPNFTDELKDELNLFIIDGDWRDDRYTDVLELYNDGLEKFNEIRKPKVVIDATIDSLLNVIEEQYYWDKLVLGDVIKVKYPQMKIEYMAKIIEINLDLQNDEVSLVIANTTDLLNEKDKLMQILNSSSNATSLIENNKYKWDKINAIAKEVHSIVTQEWDANKNKIIAGVNNTIEIGSRGVIVKSPDFPNEVIIIQSGIIALSKDGGETWKTAIKPDGIVAERLIGQIIAGQNLLITNSAGTFTMDDNGVQIDASYFVVRSSSGSGTVNLRDVWNGTTNFVDGLIDDNIITPYEKKSLKSEWEKIKALYDSIVIRLNGYYENQGLDIPSVNILHQKYQDLYNYLFTESQSDGIALLADTNMTQSTRIDRIIFEKRFKDYDTYRIKVEEILTLRAKELAQTAIEIADEARDNIAEIENDIVWKIEITSSKGFTFKNGIIDTVVSAKVYRGKDDVTATVPNAGFIWKKYDKNGVPDTPWNIAHAGVGNVISITSNDVKEKAVISCDIDINN